MRADMAEMRMMMNPTSSVNVSVDPMVAHCQSMPDMAGCERYR